MRDLGEARAFGTAGKRTVTDVIQKAGFRMEKSNDAGRRPLSTPRSPPVLPASRGLTVIELVAVMGVFACLCTLSVPHLLSWRNRARMNRAAMEVMSVYQNARILAVRENAPVLVRVDSGEDGYTVFVDNGVGNHRGNGNPDGDEKILEGALPPGVHIDRVTRKTVGFNSRGIPHFGTTVTLADRGGACKRVIVSPSGHSRVEGGR